MKKILSRSFATALSILWLTACDKTYICNCGYESGGLPYKKIYMKAKTDNSAERRCKKEAEAGEACSLE